MRKNVEFSTEDKLYGVTEEYDGSLPKFNFTKQVNEMILDTLSGMIGSQLERDKLFTVDDGVLVFQLWFKGHVDPEIVERFDGKRADEMHAYGIFVDVDDPINIDKKTGKIQYNLFIEKNPSGLDEEYDVGYLGDIPKALLPSSEDESSEDDSLHNEYSSKTGGANTEIQKNFSDSKEE